MFQLDERVERTLVEILWDHLFRGQKIVKTFLYPSSWSPAEIIIQFYVLVIHFVVGFICCRGWSFQDSGADRALLGVVIHELVVSIVSFNSRCELKKLIRGIEHYTEHCVIDHIIEFWKLSTIMFD